MMSAIRHSLFVLLGLLLPNLYLSAAIEHVHSRVAGTDFVLNKVVTVTDQQYTTMATLGSGSWGFVNSSSTGIIELGIDRYSSVYAGNSQDFWVHLQVKYDTYSSGSFSTTTLSGASVVKLHIDFAASTAGSVDKIIYKIPGAYKMEVKIVAITDDGTPPTSISPPGNLYLDTKIEVDRHHDFAHTNLPTGVGHVLKDKDSDGIKDELEISWDFIPGAEEYQLEYAVLSSLTGNRNGSGAITEFAASQVAFTDDDFLHNSTRIATTEQKYVIPVIMEGSYVVYRVRGVGKGGPSAGDYSKLKFGKWSSDDGVSKADVNDYPNYCKIDHAVAHEQLLNWQVTATFAEEGKRKDVITYFDGSLRNRQVVTKINSEGNIVAGETIYDYQGRPAINVLPVPLSGSNVKYTDGLAMYNQTTEYSKAHFDIDNNSTCGNIVQMMDSVYSLSGKYYSGGNNIAQSHQDYIPSAQGYPFTMIEYEPDNTGRVRSQSGVGYAHRMGGGHETKYFYGAAKQEELDRLFGSEVGYAQHYKKNLVVDPNGQTSISYLDMQGRVIATALVGDTLSNLLTLRNPVGNGLAGTTTTMNVDLLNKTAAGDVDDSFDNNHVSTDGMELYYNAEELVAGSGKLYKWNYTLDNTAFDDTCFVTENCYKLVYDLSISVTDQCGTEMLNSGTPFTQIINSDYSTSPLSCATVDVTVPFSPNLNATLSTGSYSISKRLKVNTTALDYYTERYISDLDTNCIYTYSDFIEKVNDSLQTSPCPMTCAECVTNLNNVLGSRTTYINGGATQAEQDARAIEWDNIYNECNEPCKQKSLCEVRYEMLLNDVSPNGQYGSVTGDMSHSVYNVSNVLEQATGVAHDWQNPSTDYLDQDGQISWIPLTDLGNNVYSPALRTSQNPTVINGVKYCQPEQLENVADFLTFWRSTWAKSLVAYHPEYAYYQLCVELSERDPNANYSSDEFDAALYQYDTYTAAGSATVGASTLNLSGLNNLLALDPFFASGGQGVSYYSAMNTEIGNYQGSGKTIYEIAAISAKCGSWYGSNYSTCMNGHTYGSNATYRDEEWNMLKSLYTSLKQKYMQKAWDEYMITNAGSTNNKFYCGCIGDLSYNPIESQHPSGLWPSVFMSVHQPCGAFHYGEYSGKQRRFGIPDLTVFASQVDANAYNSTGLCPTALDIQYLLNEMAQNDKLKATAENLYNYGTFNQDLYKELTGLNPSTNNYVQFQWNGTSSGYGLKVTLNNWPTAVCSDTSFINLNLPSSSGLSWANYPGTWSINRISTLYPTGSNTFEISAFIDHDNSTTTADIEYVLTGKLATCLSLNDCSFPDTCTTYDFANDFQNLFNTLSQAGVVNNASVTLTGNTNYEYFLNPRLKSYFPGSGTLYWSKSGTYYEINDGTKYLRFTLASAVTSGQYLTNIQGNDAFNPPSVTTGGRVSINGAALTNVTVSLYNGTTTSYLGLGKCGPINGPNCETEEYTNLTDLEIFLNRFFRPVGSPTFTPTSTFSNHWAWSEGLQENMDADTDDILSGDGSITSGLFYLPIIANSDTNDVRCTITLALADPSNPNNSGFSFSSVTGLAELTPDYSQKDANGNVIGFFVKAYMTRDEPYFLKGTGCLPIDVCETCIPTPAQPHACKQESDQYDAYMGSYPSYFSLTETEICEGGLENCVDAYLSYLTKMGINDSTDAGYILLADFCQGGYFSYSEVYANFIDSVFTGAFDTTSFKWTYLWEFAAGSYSSACRKDYVTYVSYGTPTLSLAEFCSGYTPSEPCRAPWASDPPQWPTISQPEINCSDYAQAVAHATAQQQYDAYIEALKDQFRQRYIDACIKNAVETFTMEYPETEYHHTLYYYDQAGNLTRTVPPQGVKVETNSSNLAQIKTDRQNNTQVYKTSHAFATTYTYNSLNQLVKQNTPDGGTSTFWYDHLGRIVVSQNAKQVLSNLYSYTLYDGLGRVVEAGQASNGSAMNSTIAKDASSLATWINNANLSEITVSYYDGVNTAIFNPGTNPFTSGQTNLRKRIAHVAYFPTETDKTNNAFQHATHYSYDIHGNVRELVQDFPAMQSQLSGQEYKLISYEYDLISGNVHQVKYQPGKTDQYYHKYYYDSDNRITMVMTSTDNTHWDRDAKYFYYKHGPIARKELGHHKVQGEDYAYTIQGWIKGVNSNTLRENRDMGKDGHGATTNLNRYFGADAFGYSLDYFANDYLAKAKTGGGYSASGFFIAQTSAASYLATNAPELYNGNIRSMVTTIRKPDGSSNVPVALRTAYRYDQLNRIKQMKMYRDIDTANNAWGNGSTATNEFAERFVYDHNGNILQQKRNGNNSQLNMDNLSYFYYRQSGSTYDPMNLTTPSDATNRLAYVTDAVSSGNYTTDIDGGQSTTNYTYDAIGQLTGDAQEQIANITWTVSGKVKKVVRSNSSGKPDLEFVYDAMGHRVAKIVKPDGSSVENGGTDIPGNWTYSFYTLDASGNTMSVYKKIPSGPLTLLEQNIYGSSREGAINQNKGLDTATIASTVVYNLIGDKQYQHANHLGNVLATVSDVPVADNGGSGSVTLRFKPDYLSGNAYSSFGAPLAENDWNWGTEYRYGFNGQEKDDEIYGDENSYSAEFWQYDPRLGRRWNIDPVTRASDSPYSTNMDNPIKFYDPDGDCPWCIIMGGVALISYGMEVYNNWDSNGSNYDNFFGNVNWISVAASAASAIPGGGWIINVTVGAVESSVEWTPNDGFTFNNVEESVMNFFLDGVSEKAAGAFDTYIRKIGSDKVLKQSRDQVKEYTKKASTAEKKALRGNEKQKVKADTYKAKAEQARKSQVRSQMANGYSNNVNEEVGKEIIKQTVEGTVKSNTPSSSDSTGTQRAKGRSGQRTITRVAF